MITYNQLEHMVESIQPGSIQFENNWGEVGREQYGDEVSPWTRIVSNDGAIKQILPVLLNVEDYQDWVRHILTRDGTYKVFKVDKSNLALTEGYAVYEGENTITYEGEYTIEQWKVHKSTLGFGEDQELRHHIYCKTNTGLEVDDDCPSEVDLELRSRRDMYKNPDNEDKILYRPLFLDPPQGSYWGEKIYYNPVCEAWLCVKLSGGWVWVDKQSFCKNPPAEFVQELNVLNNS